MRFEPLSIDGAFLVRTEPRADPRGRFVRVYCEQAFAAVLPQPRAQAGGDDGHRWVQCNLSLTAHRGTVRGLHYQRAPAAETKLVRPVAGSVWDVIVDLRVGSPTYLRWQAVTLTAGDDTQVLIPEGVAHGFQALCDDAQLLYFHSHAYSPEHESGVRYDDPRLAIAWPLPVVHLSPRDAAFAPLDGRPEGVTA